MKKRIIIAVVIISILALIGSCESENNTTDEDFLKWYIENDN